MKIAFSSTGMDLDSEIDPRFGRCAYFLIVNSDDMSLEAIANESMYLGGGAGIQSGQFIASKGAQVVIAGSIGPNASRTLNAAGVDIILGVSGPIREALERYKSGELSPANQPNAPDHYGMGMSGGQTAYPGEGTGSRMGIGRGMGVQGEYSPNRGSSAPLPDQGLAALKEEAKAVRNQLNSMLSRIKDLDMDNSGKQ